MKLPFLNTKSSTHLSDEVDIVDRVIWQVASLLLAYPDTRYQDRLTTAEHLLDSLSEVDHPGIPPLRKAFDTLKALSQFDVELVYVDTFDMRRNDTMFLTYWGSGETRNRGAHMLTFTQAYRRNGVRSPAGEAPDYLPVVLEFAATVNPYMGKQLLAAHRISIDMLHHGLTNFGSPYLGVIEAVRQTLPEASDEEVKEIRKLLESGPPAEAVGLQPYSLDIDLSTPKVSAQ